MGLVVMLFVATSAFSGVYTFMEARDRFGLPTFANLPGAFLVSMSVVAMSGWLSNSFGLFDNMTGVVSAMPEVPWYLWIVYLLSGLGWYFVAFTVKRRFTGWLNGKEVSGE